MSQLKSSMGTTCKPAEESHRSGCNVVRMNSSTPTGSQPAASHKTAALCQGSYKAVAVWTEDAPDQLCKVSAVQPNAEDETRLVDALSRSR